MGLQQHLCDLAEHTSRTCPDPERICVAGLCGISSSGSGALNSGGLLAGFVRAALVVSSFGAHVAPSSACLAEESSTQLNQSLCAFSPLLNTVDLSVTSTQRCFVSCGSCLPLPQQGDPVALRKHGKPFTELVLGDQPSPALSEEENSRQQQEEFPRACS